jgi:cell wall-associated NlpC family hydrolase
MHAFVACACLAAALTGGATAGAQSFVSDGSVPSSTSGGGAMFVPPPPPPKKAKIVNGLAIAPRNAPRAVKRMIEAGNRIIGKPYVYGGGHKIYARSSRTRRTQLDRGYDCSGTVSFALYGARLLRSPLDSSSFMSWGRAGVGRWVTVYTNPSHAYIVIAGLRLDTSLRDDPSRTGPGWSRRLRTSANGAFVARHPRNL